MKMASIGIDIGKTTFHLVALDEHGSTVIRRKFWRKALLTYGAKLKTSLIGMEACGGAHCLARLLRDQGHQVRLIPGQFVKPYRQSSKNDYLDAEAIAEAVTRKKLRFVAIKTEDQLDVQGLHRVRERLVTTAPRLSTRFAVFCWSAASRSVEGRRACARGCQIC